MYVFSYWMMLHGILCISSQKQAGINPATTLKTGIRYRSQMPTHRLPCTYKIHHKQSKVAGIEIYKGSPIPMISDGLKPRF
jgi:hypothetical protein